MSYDEEQQRRSRVVVETPTARREVVHQQTTRYAPPEREGYSTGMLAAVALTAIAATAILFLFLMYSRDDSTETSVNVRAAATPYQQPAQPAMVQPPAPMPSQQQPVIITQPAPVIEAPPPVVITQPAPVTVAPPASAAGTQPATAPSTANSGASDQTLEANITKAFNEDVTVAALNVDVLVVNGKVTLMGQVETPEQKSRAEKVAYQVKGVRSVENRITVSP